VVVGVLLQAEGQLPAHVGLPVEGPLTGLQRRVVERAPEAPREAGPVQEDAGTVDDAGLALALAVLAGGPALAPGRVLQLPLLRGEPGRVGQGVGLVVLVHEVRAVAAAAVGELRGGAGEDPLAALPVDAAPGAREVGEV